MVTTFCTLFEGDYHLGAAALINSLHRAGFSGTIALGYRGEAPAWRDTPASSLGAIRLLWVPIDSKIHLTNYKPTWMSACMDQHVPDTEQIAYADPDLVVKCPAAVLARWAKGGLALCKDTNNDIPTRHPLRLSWFDFLATHGVEPVREVDHYYNAGFLALPRSNRSFLDTWQKVLDLAATHLGALDQIKRKSPHDLFFSMDQDAMNMALHLGKWPINAAGPEAMDLAPGGHYLSHALGRRKPWRGGFLKSALAGYAPSLAVKHFHDHIEGPIPVFPPALARRRRRELALASAIGRFYKRA